MGPDSVAVNDDNDTHNVVTIVESSSSIRGSAEVGANIPEAFAAVRVAFDVTRDRTTSKKVQICCRTQTRYYFDSTTSEKTRFEEKLRQFKKEKGDVYKDLWCEYFLKENNNITQYVSSITLGAMTCTVLEKTTKTKSLQIDVEAEGPRVKAGGGFRKKREEMAARLEEKKIGVFTPDTKEIATPDVVHYECKDVLSLVSDPALRKELERAIRQYEVTRGNCIKAGYSIFTDGLPINM